MREGQAVVEKETSRKQRVGDGTPGPGRHKGVPNRTTRTIREAVERAARDCHPAGLAGWLVERANGGIADRQIFAGLVGKVIPLQVKTSVEGGIKIELGWLGGRQIGATAAQIEAPASHVIDLAPETDGSYRIIDPARQATPAPAAGADAGGDQLEAAEPPETRQEGAGAHGEGEGRRG